MTFLKGSEYLISACLALLLLMCGASSAAEYTAKSIFDEKESLVYQIRVVDIGSGDKYSIGSGFRISESGHVATNFHVVSSYVHEPDKYRLEYIAADDSVGDLALLAVDVVHDLAIAHTGLQNSSYFKLSPNELSKGERIYSMGNPNDLGMTIVEGNYNGQVDKSRYRKILFSGSLNPGMSGGPAMNTDGEIIGVNVSKGGEQISFLVPVEHLLSLQLSLSETANEPDFKEIINQALLADQNRFYGALLDAPFQEKQLGKLLVAQKLHDSLKCWGHTVDEDDVKYEAVHQHCQSEDEIYVSRGLYVGNFNYDVEMIDSKALNRFQFYTLLEQRFNHRSLRNTRGMEEVTSYACYDNLVKLSSGSWKVSTCSRAYKKYVGLYDSSMVMVSMDYPDYAAIVSIAASGVSADNAQALFKKVQGALSWIH